MRHNSPTAGQITFPEVGETPVSWGEMNLQRADKYKAIVNPETGKVFSIVSKDYKLIRHKEAIKEIESTIRDFPKLGKCNTTTEFYNDGGRMRRTYLFYEHRVEVQSGDKVSPELNLFNSYDVTWPFIVLLGAFRFVCANGLVVGRKYLHIRKRHVFDLDQMDLGKEVSTALRRFNLQTAQWKKWTERRLTEKIYNRVIDSMNFGLTAMDEVHLKVYDDAESLDANYFPVMNLWVFYNILTWYITHRSVSLNHRVEMERKLRSATKYFG